MKAKANKPTGDTKHMVGRYIQTNRQTNKQTNISFEDNELDGGLEYKFSM